MIKAYCSVILLVLAMLVHGQTNTDCSSAALACAQQPASGSTTGSTGSVPGFCPGTSNARWFTFSTNSVGGVVTANISAIGCPGGPDVGDELTVVILSGQPDCDLASFTAASVCASGTSSVSVTSDPLAPNTQYWVLVAGEQDTGGVAECPFTLEVNGPGADVLGIDLIVSEDMIIGTGETTQLQVIGGTNINWEPPTGLSNTNARDPIASPPGTTTYTVTATVPNAAGDCIYTDQVIIEVIRRIAPPNTFTPNGDGKNDTWEIIGISDYPGAEVLIFDRWGQRVFSSTGYREPWDGRSGGGGRLPDGTYYYHIQLNQLEGRAPPYTGFISIIR